ncbi:MAG: CPBP family intramembrane metalloprotease [Firmicutes bacterium]|jgi:membrane protease YdiL (CAAX protease family)|nr:CPBP family intramembrane metalloprotease [Bacillota bacterium]NLL88634.1 CPBP family intramembrane metalloprotease [Bacillota bacterium]HKM16957.1 CPBP family intramembrane glutamic endopeptidase [Limnochordia bacterium]
MVDRRWLVIVTLGWMAMIAARSAVAIESGEQLLLWMLMQQLWLICGSLQAVRQASVLRWDRKDLGKGVLIGVGLFAAIVLINLTTISCLRLVFSEVQVQQWLMREQTGVQMLLSIKNAAKFWLAAVSITIGASVSEELFFRGAILKAFCHVMPTKWAVFLGALAFAGVHFYLVQFIPVLVSGIILGVLFVKSNNLVSTMAAHATVNTLALVAHIL